MSKENMEQVSFEELWSKLSGSTSFGQDEIIEMLAVQDDADKDFCIYHRNSAFCVPLHKIREFFTRHKKPVPPMTQDQELKYLRGKVQKLQDEAEAYVGQGKIARPAPDAPDEPEVLEPIEHPVELSEPLDPDTDPGSSADAEPAKVIAPKRDESIPPPQDREKMSRKEIQAMLAKELKDKKPAKQKLMDNAKPKDIMRAPKEQ